MNTVQNIFNEFFPMFKTKHRVCAQQARAAVDIMHCRTKELGGRVYRCSSCEHTEIRYNSCRNRNCPQCQGIKRILWADQRTKDVIDAPYFHLVFTVPEELQLLILKQYYYENLIKFHGSMEEYKNPQSFENLLTRCYTKDWYSYTKKAFSGPTAVINYLAGYTHRVAISNKRIISVDMERVKIAVKDRKNNNKSKIISLDAVEFIRRFLMHVLPKGFIKIRYYGIIANRNKEVKLQLCRQLTSSSTYKSKYENLKIIEILSMLVGRNIMMCSSCKKNILKHVETLYAGQSP